MKVESDRVRGTLKMPPKEVFGNEQFSFTATVDAAIITPSTRIVGPGDPVEKADYPILATSPVAFPQEIENAGREGSKFRKKYSLPFPLLVDRGQKVAALYPSQEVEEYTELFFGRIQQWREDAGARDEGPVAVGAGTALTRCDGVRGDTLSPHNLQSVDHEEDTCMKLRIGKCKAASKETRRC
jgi:hypothetical protein